MAGSTIGSGNLTFGDGTSISSTSIPYTNVTNPKTKLSQFTNDLGNYGGFITGVNTSSLGAGALPSLRVNLSGTTLILETNNCNCNCACNC